jgi:hypothetical protein
MRPRLDSSQGQPGSARRPRHALRRSSSAASVAREPLAQARRSLATPSPPRRCSSPGSECMGFIDLDLIFPVIGSAHFVFVLAVMASSRGCLGLVPLAQTVRGWLPLRRLGGRWRSPSEPSSKTPRSAHYPPKTSATDSSPNSTSPSATPRHKHRSHPPRAARRRPRPPDHPRTYTHAQSLSQAVGSDKINSLDRCVRSTYWLQARPVLQRTSPQRN